jgi:hypothetical protein
MGIDSPSSITFDIQEQKPKKYPTRNKTLYELGE